MNWVLFGVLAYIMVQFGVGAYVSRRIRTEDDYLVAGRSLGYGVAIFTIFATWFGAETCIGAAGAIYSEGLSGGSADPFGYAACLFLMGILFAVPLWRLKLTTLADLFRIRFAPRVERVAVLLMVPTSLLWGAAQIRAFGQVLAASSGFEVSLTISFAALVVILYTIFGGLLSDAWTDVIQGIALMIGLIVLFVMVMRDGGLSMLGTVDPERLQLFGGDSVSWTMVLEQWAIPICGSAVAAELVARVIAVRSPQVARRSSLLAGTVYFAFGLIPVAIGLIGFIRFPELTNPEQILPIMARHYLPAFLYTLFAGALVSAILSTVDSALLVAAGFVSHNLIVPLRPHLSEKEKVQIARGGVAVFGLLAYIMALHAEGVYALVEEASAFGSAGIFVVIVFGLFTRLGGAHSALMSLLTGIFLWVVGAYVLDIPYPYLTSLFGSVVAYLTTASIESRLLKTRAAVDVAR